MTRLATTPAILGILLTGMVAVLVGCSSNPAGLGLQKVDAQAPALDAAAGHGGVGGAGSDAAVGGSGGSGGVAGSGGVTATGGVTQTGGTTGTGGTTRTGGATGTGGPTPTGGTTGDGGATRTGGTTGAGGATVTGGSTRTGGATGSGGTTQTGGATRTGGATGNGGSTGGGGSTRIGGAIGNGGSTGAGGTTGAGGSTRTGGTTASGGNTGTAGAGGAGKTCGGNVGTSCAVGEFCDIQAGLCNAAGATGTCAVKPQICGDVYQPVCGCDRTTYANDCARQVAGVSKRSNGACATGDAGATTCGQVTTQADCDSRSDCHSVFVDPGTCGCAVAGCCAHFNICANGGHANCSGPVAFGCTIAPPFCELPYVLSYTANCYEGCVRQSECAGVDAGTPATCPSTPPTNASSCSSPSMTCFYDNCPATGRTQATCTGGTWSVQTAACGTVSCTGNPYSGGMTCPSGQMCLISVGGALLARCIDNACGQGPVTSQCSYVASGCSMNATPTTGVTFTCYTCPVGEVCG